MLPPRGHLASSSDTTEPTSPAPEAPDTSKSEELSLEELDGVSGGVRAKIGGDGFTATQSAGS